MSSVDNVDLALDLRQQILKANACGFDAIITADYTDKIYTFSLRCNVDSAGIMKFEVIEQKSISGIAGTISSTQQSLTFDNTVLAFAPMADGYITPVCAPWVFINSLRCGYINSCTETKDGLIISIDDSDIYKIISVAFKDKPSILLLADFRIISEILNPDCKSNFYFRSFSYKGGDGGS